ncbi:DUF5686 family protein [Flammeovirga sp. SJP92]|uniref:DUF5686 family protein n=1 Tax=Flammeovirga sp. SJP92 TaxID=1775430 RepID=UPI0015603EA5|nr:DUF5686 family protein [Flammeovirga sp. SJP92]
MKGKVIDANTLLPVGYVHFTLSHISQGTTSSIDGEFILPYVNSSDTIHVSCLGYTSQSIAVDSLSFTEINVIRLHKDVKKLQEVVVGRKGYENPAWEIIRLAMKNSPDHNFHGNKDFNYQSSIRTNVYITDTNERFLNQKLVKEAIRRMEEIDTLSINQDGMPNIPVYSSTSEQTVTYHASQRAEDREQSYYKEAFLGPEFENQFRQGLDNEKTTVNFYQQWLRFLAKDFSSPLNPTFKNYYDFELVTYEKVDGDWCYRIDFVPRRQNDMTFGGTLWVTDENKGFAVKKVKAEIGRASPINFIDSITVDQKLAAIDTSKIWFPYQQNIKMWVGGKLNKDWTKFLVDINTKNTFPSEDSLLHSQPTDTTIYAMLDTVKQMPAVKATAKVIDIGVTGYYRAGGFDFGPLTVLYAQNNVEGNRMQFGGLTNTQWNPNLIGGGYVAYGTNDQEWKWGVMGKYILNHENWTFLYARAQHSLQRLGAGITFPGQDPYLWISQAWGTFTNPYYLDEVNVIASSYVAEGIQLRGSFTYKDENYFTTELTDTLAFSQITTSELAGSIIFDFGKRYVSSRHLNRYIAANGKFPTITLSYKRGLPTLFDATDSYHKLELLMSHRFKIGALGRMDYVVSSGWTPSTVPFPLLFVHRGNNLKYIYNRTSYNLMDFGEFMSDRYVGLRMFHHFEGLFINRIPIVKKMNIKAFGIANLLWGGVSDANLAANVNPWDRDEASFKSLDPSKPYVEVGGGVENIFRMLKVMFLYRATYQEDASRKYGVMFAITPEF